MRIVFDELETVDADVTRLSATLEPETIEDRLIMNLIDKQPQLLEIKSLANNGWLWKWNKAKARNKRETDTP